jgi:glycosyltransferase involved in cell wall biosynthesis
MQKRFKILLSAYACEPNKGSEPGVGWHWAMEVSKRGHQVCVLTRKNNQNIIEAYFRDNLQPDNLKFIYYDLPKYLTSWKKGGRGVHLYYFLWQICVLKIAFKAHKSIQFDLVHHVTFVTIHQPSFLYLLNNTKFFYGPCAGGDVVPIRYLKSFPLLKRLKEYLIYLQNHLLSIDFFRLLMFHKASLIFSNSKNTQSFIPKKWLTKNKISLAIGSTKLALNFSEKVVSNEFNLLYVGNFLHWKGLHLVLKMLDNCYEYVQLTLIGKGNFDNTLKKTATNIKIINWLPQIELFELYKTYDLMIFPSFRDSGGMVVLEAMSNGLPVICLDLGGPGQIVNETCGRVISTKNRTEEEVVLALSEAINELASNKELRSALSKGAIERAKEFTWDKTVGRVYEQIEQQMDKISK